MKNTFHPFLRKFSATGLVMLAFLPGISETLAAPGTLSNVPLYVGPNVEPNVVFLNDDSGSMEFSVMTPEDGGYMWLGPNGDEEEYLYTHPVRIEGSTSNADWRGQSYSYGGSGSLSTFSGQARVLPPLQAIEYCFNTLTTQEKGAWRAWNHNYNKLYYNPEITYTPWVGVNKNGAPYGNATPSAALVNPYNPDVGTENLTANREYTTRYPRNRSSGKSTSDCAKDAHNNWKIVTSGTNYAPFYPAHYYVWTDTDGDGQVDPDDGKARIEIKSGQTYTGSTKRTDCATAPTCTYAEEIQNFANWFSYYRNRDLTAKNGATAAIEGITGIRVGYATINDNTTARSRVASMNLDPASGNKRTLFSKIFGALPGAGVGTPLRTALHQTGLYYECKSGNIMNASGSNCPILSAAQGGMCQKNYTILMTDGFWNDASNPGISSANADGNNNTDWDGPPYGDTYSYTLADVAMHYYERDLSTSLTNEIKSPTGAKDNAPHQHMTTYTVAFGVAGTLDPSVDDPASSGFSWPNPISGDNDPRKIDDLWHAAYNGRGEFFNAQDPAALAEGLKAAFESVTRGRSASSSVAFNTSRITTNGILYQATFNPSDNWAGELTALHLTSKGEIQSEVWNASSLLNQIDPDDRLILTYNDDGKTGLPFKTLDDLSTRQKNDLNMGPSGTADGFGQDRINYLRGDRSNEGPENGREFRERSALLGDITYSTPVYVGKPELGYIDDPSFGDGEYSSFRSGNVSRQPVVYVGSNDGMLHGFLANTGQEVFAYMPNKLFSNQANEGMHYLTDPTYAHRYYVDLAPTVSDAYISSGWRTVLIGGYRAGGRGLFALDVTNPSAFSEENADDIVLWEFSSDDDTDLGHTFSKPTMALMENGKWAAIFGNGYNDLGSGAAKLYILFLDQGMDGTWSLGSDYLKISTGVGTTSNRNGLSTPVLVDSNGNGKVDRVYAGDLMGNLWAFDVSSDNQSGWGVAYKDGATPKALFNASISGVAQPITAKPVVARNPQVTTSPGNKPNILVFFGTGQYMVSGDKSSSATQSFYGIWDNGGSASALPRTRANLVAQTLDTDNSTSDLRVTSDNPVNFGTQYGWRFDLPTSRERVVTDPKVRGEYVFFTTLIPDTGVCDAKGEGWIMALKLANGGGPNKPVFDKDNNGEVNSADLIDGTYSPSGKRKEGELSAISFVETEDGTMAFTQNNDAELSGEAVDPGTGSSGRLSWREIR